MNGARQGVLMLNGKADAQDGPRPGLVSGHIARALAVAAFACALVIGMAMTAAGWVWLPGAFVAELRADTETVVRSAINPRSFPTLEELVATGEHLVRVSDIVGGTYFTAVGVARASFGDPPELGWAEARLEGEPWSFDRRTGVFETFIAPEEIGLAHGLMVKVQAAGAWQVRRERIALLAAICLWAAAAFAGAMLLIARRLVAGRLGAIEAALDAGLDAPAKAATPLSRLAGRDEITRLSRQADRLLCRVASSFDQHMATILFEQSPFAVLTCAPDGRVLSANAAALRVFDVAEIDSLPGRDGTVVCLFRGEPKTVMELIGEGPVLGPGEIILPDDTVPVRVGADTVYGFEGAVLGHVIMLVDMRDMVADMRREVALREASEKRQRRAEAELAWLRRQLEACLVILEREQERQPPRTSASIEPDAVLAEWLAGAVRRGDMAADGLLHDALPRLSGEAGSMRLLFHFVLETVRRRSGQTMPSILVDATEEGARVRLTLCATGPTADVPCGAIVRHGEDTLMIAAIAGLARGQGGELVAGRHGKAGNAITVWLPREAGQMAPAASAA